MAGQGPEVFPGETDAAIWSGFSPGCRQPDPGCGRNAGNLGFGTVSGHGPGGASQHAASGRKPRGCQCHPAIRVWRRLSSAVRRPLVRYSVQQFGDRTRRRSGGAGAVCTGGQALGTRILGADSQSLVRDRDPSAHSARASSASGFESLCGAALHCLAMDQQTGPGIQTLLHRTLHFRYPAALRRGTAGLVSGCDYSA